MEKISIDPITRLEGHGRIDIFLNDEGDVEKKDGGGEDGAKKEEEKGK